MPRRALDSSTASRSSYDLKNHFPGGLHHLHGSYAETARLSGMGILDFDGARQPPR
jgi:hypothetical protein